VGAGADPHAFACESGQSGRDDFARRAEAGAFQIAADADQDHLGFSAPWGA
jgi:hypothetical protein